jgi:hypothetical protein
MKMAAFWVVAPCSHPDDGGSNHLWNIGKLLPDYTAQQSRRQPSSRKITLGFEVLTAVSMKITLFIRGKDDFCVMNLESE